MEDRSAWLRDARGRSGKTQDKLALMAKVSTRTVQRAEEGKMMSHRVWQKLEAQLGSAPMLARRRTSDGAETSSFFRKTFKTLRRLRTAKELLDAMTITSTSKLDYDVEPNAEILPVLRVVVEWLEARLPDAWDVSRRRYRPPSVLTRLEDETALNGLIDRLDEIGASLFWEQYWEDIYYPQEAVGFDDDVHLYVDKDHKPEGRFLLQVVISASEKDQETFPEVMNWGVEVVESDDSDVPF